MDRLNKTTHQPVEKMDSQPFDSDMDNSATQGIKSPGNVEKKVVLNHQHGDETSANKPFSERVVTNSAASLPSRSDDEVETFRKGFESEWRQLFINSKDMDDIEFEQALDRIADCYKHRSSVLNLSDCGLNNLFYICQGEQMPSLAPLAEHVTELDLSNNGKQSFEPDGMLYNFACLSKLEKLILDKCCYRDIPEKEIHDCGEEWPKLTCLSLKDNDLSDFPAGIDSLKNLQALYLEDNRIGNFLESDCEKEILAKTGLEARQQGKILKIYMNGNFSDIDEGNEMAAQLKGNKEQLFNIELSGLDDLKQESDDEF